MLPTTKKKSTASVRREVEATDFFLALFAGLRFHGVQDIAYVENALEKGLLASMNYCVSKNFSLKFPHSVVNSVLHKGLRTAERYGIISYPNPTYQHIAMRLASKSAAEKYLQEIISDDNERNIFIDCAGEFLKSFEKAFDSKQLG